MVVSPVSPSGVCQMNKFETRQRRPPGVNNCVKVDITKIERCKEYFGFRRAKACPYQCVSKRFGYTFFGTNVIFSPPRHLE